MGTERGGASLHVYNARCALTVEPSRNRAGTVHTANFETAARPGPGTDFAWDAKLVVQVTGAELPDVIATLLGHRETIEFLYHGAARDKGYRLFRDGERFVLQVFQGAKERHTVRLAEADRLAVSVVLFRQMQRNHGGLPADVLYAMLERIYTRTSDAPSSAASPDVPAPATPSVPDPRPAGANDLPAGDGPEPPASSGDRSASAPDDSPDPYDW